MGTVSYLRPEDTVTIQRAIDAYISNHLATPSRSPGTRRVFETTLRLFADHFGPDTPLHALDADQVAEWFTARWGDMSPATWNRNLSTIRSAIRYWADQGWAVDEQLTRRLSNQKTPTDRTRALSRAQIERLLSRKDVPLRDKTLWRMLYETAARCSEVLALNVEHLDLRNRCARVRRKGGAVDVIYWQTGTARLLPRLIGARKSGPLFLTDRRARVELNAADLDPETGRARLSYRRAAEIFEQATNDYEGGPWTLHQLRHSALTHAAEAGANTATLMAYSGHSNVASLQRYARVSPEALGRWQAERDPLRRG